MYSVSLMYIHPHSNVGLNMLANTRFAKDEQLELRRQYKSRADTVLLSRSRKNQSDDVLKLKTPTSEDDIFAMLSACIKR